MEHNDNMTPKVGDQLRQQAATVREDLRELGRLTKEAAQEKLGVATETVGEYLDQGRRKAGEMEEKLETYVRAKPMKSVLIAAGVGMLCGFFLSRR